MKQCKKCGEHKPLTEFYKNSRSKDGIDYYCKSCQKEGANKRLNAKWAAGYNGKYAVYYLPEEHYVGMTNNLIRRMHKHGQKSKCTEGYEIIGEYETAIEAHLVETQLHFMGYEGFHYKF